MALSGAHALGRCHPDASGYSGPWNPTPYLLNNNYFKLLVRIQPVARPMPYIIIP